MKLLSTAALIAALLLTTTVNAGPFENANAYYGNKYGVPDFTFTKAEFGNSNFARLIHLGLEVVVETIHGATVIYNPATDQVLVWGNAGAGTNEPVPSGTCLNLAGKRGAGTAGANGICLTPATLVGNEGGTFLDHVIAATDRSCTFDVNGVNHPTHSC